MQKRKMIKIPKIEWLAILKSVVLITACYLITVIAMTILSIIFIGLAPIELLYRLETIKGLDYILGFPADISILFGFWWSLFFIRHNKLLHMSIVVFVWFLPELLMVPFFDDYILSETLFSASIIYITMLVAYGIGEYYPKHIRKRQA